MNPNIKGEKHDLILINTIPLRMNSFPEDLPAAHTYTRDYIINNPYWRFPDSMVGE